MTITPQAQPQFRLDPAVADLLRESDGGDSIRCPLDCQSHNYCFRSMKEQRKPNITAASARRARLPAGAVSRRASSARRLLRAGPSGQDLVRAALGNVIDTQFGVRSFPNPAKPEPNRLKY